MASNLQSAGCCLSFTNGALYASVTGSSSPSHRHAKTITTRNSLGGDDYNLSNVDCNDNAAKWLSADFLDLRLRSNGLICNEAIQALRKHFKQTDEGLPATPSEAGPSKSVRKVDRAPPSAHQINTRPLPNVVFYDETVHSQLYTSNNTYATTFSFLDESFC